MYLCLSSLCLSLSLFVLAHSSFFFCLLLSVFFSVCLLFFSLFSRSLCLLHLLLALPLSVYLSINLSIYPFAVISLYPLSLSGDRDLRALQLYPLHRLQHNHRHKQVLRDRDEAVCAGGYGLHTHSHIHFLTWLVV